MVLFNLNSTSKKCWMFSVVCSDAVMVIDAPFSNLSSCSGSDDEIEAEMITFGSLSRVLDKEQKRKQSWTWQKIRFVPRGKMNEAVTVLASLLLCSSSYERKFG